MRPDRLKTLAPTRGSVLSSPPLPGSVADTIWEAVITLASGMVYLLVLCLPGCGGSVEVDQGEPAIELAPVVEEVPGDRYCVERRSSDGAWVHVEECRGWCFPVTGAWECLPTEEACWEQIDRVNPRHLLGECRP